MNIVLGIVVLVLSLPCWAGQVMSVLAPPVAQQLGLMEREDDVEPVFWADVRGEAQWDSLTLWTMPAAGLLLLVDHGSWPYFGLIAAGMYIYFGGRGIAARRVMVADGLSNVGDVKVASIALTVWTLLGVAVLVASVAELA